MHSTKYVLQVAAILAIVTVVLPSFASAMPTESIGSNITFRSEHADEYDDVINLANETATNVESWDPVHTGVYIGSYTPESLFEMNTETRTGTTLGLAWEVMFSNSQIMDGASRFVVRLPLYVDAAAMKYVHLNIFDVAENGTYSIVSNVNNLVPANLSLDFTYPAITKHVWKGTLMEPGDSNPYDGNFYWTRDNRMYVDVSAPIIPGNIYVFFVTAQYRPGYHPAFYMSPNDISSDGLVTSKIFIRSPTDPDTAITDSRTLKVDLGFSFDMRNSMGGIVTSQSYYLYAGSAVFFRCYFPGAGTTTGYPSIMVPFRTANGTAAFDVSIHDYGGNQILDQDDVVGEGYILACGASNTPSGNATRYGSFLDIRMDSLWNQRVTFLFETLDCPDDGIAISGEEPIDAIYNITTNTRIIGTYGTANYGIRMHLFSTFLLTSDPLTSPSIVGVSPLAFEETSYSKSKWEGAIAVLAGFTPITKAIYIATHPEMMQNADVFTYIGWATPGPLGMLPWLHSVQQTFPDLLPPGMDPLGDLKNLIDKIWNALMDFGKWLWSVGEAILTFLVQLVDSVAFWLSQLGGMAFLMIEVVFFVGCILGTLKIMRIFLKFAQGNTEQATAEAAGLVNTATGAVSGASSLFGKLRGRL